MFERGQHIYTVNHGAEGYDPAKPAPATYLGKNDAPLTIMVAGEPLHEIVFGHVEVTEGMVDEGLAFSDELFATYEEAEAAL